jgi:hypothetical protein
MRIYQHRKNLSIARDTTYPVAKDYEPLDFASDYSEHMFVSFDHFESHRSSATAWFVELSYDYDSWSDSYSRTDRFLPMRIGEFQKLLLQGRDMLFLEGFFGFRKQGSSVGIELRQEGYGL